MPLLDLFLARFAVPVVATALAAALIWVVSRRTDATRTAALAVPVGLIAGYAVVPGWSWAPPIHAMDKLVWLALGGALLGLAIDLGTRGRIAPAVAALVWPAAGMAWIGGPMLLSGEGASMYPFGEVSLVLGLLLARLSQLSNDRLQGPVTAAVIAAGIACLGLVSGEPGLAAIGLPLAAALSGWLLCNWPRRRFAFGAAGLLGGPGIALVLAGDAALLTGVNATLVLLVLSAVLIQPAVPAVTARVPWLAGQAVRPLVTALVLAFPAAVAVLLAWLSPDLVPSLY